MCRQLGSQSKRGRCKLSRIDSVSNSESDFLANGLKIFSQILDRRRKRGRYLALNQRFRAPVRVFFLDGRLGKSLDNFMKTFLLLHPELSLAIYWRLIIMIIA